MMDALLTNEQRAFANHRSGAFVVACPGAGKTRAIVARIARLAAELPPRKGIGVLSFTNTALEEFIRRCHAEGVISALRHPSFAGTFDSFVRQFFIAPAGLEGVAVKPMVLDSWDTMEFAKVRLRRPSHYAGPGIVTLDDFNPESNLINPDRIGYAALRDHVRTHKAAYEREAARRRTILRGLGYLSAADARVEAIGRLRMGDWSNALGLALAARFREVIVDEAQDCNPLDLQIVNWLRRHGVAVTVVADPDQAIYGFRQGDPVRLREFGQQYDSTSQLGLTGNFRSSPAICAVAATLRNRAEPDVALGDAAAYVRPVYVLSYEGAAVPATIGPWFSDLAGNLQPKASAFVVLAHSRRTAQRACGSALAIDNAGDSKVAKIARACGSFWSVAESGSGRESSLRTVERMILDLMGKIEDNETPARAAERCNINYRWLRRSALELVGGLPRTCADTNEARSEWVAALQQQVVRHALPYRARTTERNYFRNPQNTIWSRYLHAAHVQAVPCATIHEAKGHQFDAVCVVIPPDNRGSAYTEQLFGAWTRREDLEAKRVIYVGVTRARRLLALAIPASFRERLATILAAGRVEFRFHDLRAEPSGNDVAKAIQ